MRSVLALLSWCATFPRAAAAFVQSAYWPCARLELARPSPRVLSSARAAQHSADAGLPSSSKMSVDLTVYGASGFVGKLIAEYLLTTYGATPSNFKWALAGR